MTKDKSESTTETQSEKRRSGVSDPSWRSCLGRISLSVRQEPNLGALGGGDGLGRGGGGGGVVHFFPLESTKK